MVLILTAALVLLAGVVVVFLVALLASRVLLGFRSRRHVGVYRVRVGPASDGGVTGEDLDESFSSPAEAREGANRHLLGAPTGVDVAFVLAERDDGGWDVVDRVDVVASNP